MKCDRCQNEATVHEVTVHKGKKVEKHLCEQCAKTDGIAIQSHPPIAEMLTKFVTSSMGGEKSARGQAACAGCGLTYAEFRQTGLLGCEECYDAFEEQLGPLLERAQEGGSHHVGKTPRRGGGALDRGKVVATLRKQLLDAIAAEHYEKAAELRDRLRSVGADDGPSGEEVTA
jgi:protein arginine kinase activator